MSGGIGRGINRLSDRTVKAFAGKPGEARKRKLFDGAGLYVTHTKKGTAVWRLKYRIGGQDRTYSIGGYPEIGLEAARAERDIARGLIREGRDPVQARQVRRGSPRRRRRAARRSPARLSQHSRTGKRGR